MTCNNITTIKITITTRFLHEKSYSIRNSFVHTDLKALLLLLLFVVIVIIVIKLPLLCGILTLAFPQKQQHRRRIELTQQINKLQCNIFPN